MVRWLLLAVSAVVLGIGVYMLAVGDQTVGGGTIASALLFAAAAEAIGRRNRIGRNDRADQAAAPDRRGT
jgi:hypothetical protein